MGRSERRDRARIYAEILESIQRAHRSAEAPRITRIQSHVNVPFVRFKEYLDDLCRNGLVELVPELEITERGLRYVQEYQRVRRFLEDFGLTDRQAPREGLPAAFPAPDPPIGRRTRRGSERSGHESNDDKG